MSSIKEEVCIVVVLFNPSSDHIRNIEILSSYFFVIAIDNSDVSSDVKCSCYIPLNDNRGIAFAQNRGIEWAKEQGYKYVIFFDQDSKIEPSYVSGIYKEYLRIKEEDCNLAFLGPLVLDEENMMEYKSESDKKKSYSKVKTVISSGSIVSLDIFDKVGFLDENLFIDYVDCEICWRASSYGFSTYMTRNIQLCHNVGNKYIVIMGVPFGVSAPFRYYYQYRNMLWLIRRGYVPKSWKVKSFLRSILDLIVVPFISGHYYTTIKNMLKGYYDGFKKHPELVV